MHTIYRRAENEELLEVATSEDLEAAKKLVRSLKKMWPTKYVVRESKPDPNSDSSGDRH